MPKYIVAIRTLGTAGQKFARELESIKNQTLQPDKVLVFIAQGYRRPEINISDEEYIWGKKGMLNQRIQNFDNIDCDYILFLDDDIELDPNICEKMITFIEKYKLDAIGIDMYSSHNNSSFKKLKLGLLTLTLPFFSKKWAFKIKRNGSSSYNINPTKEFYYTQSLAGGAVMVRKTAYDNLKLYNEKWLDDLTYAFGEDQLMFYKFFINNYRLGVLFDKGTKHLDAQSSASLTDNDKFRRIYHISLAMVPMWHRICYEPSKVTLIKRIRTSSSFGFKIVFLSLTRTLQSVISFQPGYISSYLSGIRDGFKFLKTKAYLDLPSYLIES